MKIKIADLRKLIRENYAREIPQYAVEQAYSSSIKLKSPKRIADRCKEELEHYFKMHINSTSSSPADMRKKILKMHNVFETMKEEIIDSKNIKDELKDIIDQTVRRFLFI